MSGFPAQLWKIHLFRVRFWQDTAMQTLPGVVPLYSAAEIRTIDRLAVEEIGLPGAVLMERAGLGAAAEILTYFGDERRIAVICGAGNNGGDGFVVARHLAATGRHVDILLVETESKIRRESKIFLGIARKLGISIERVNTTKWRTVLKDYDLIVDAMLGTGVTGAPKPNVEVAIRAIEASMLPVVSLDMPTGVDASTGVVESVAVMADLTLTFHGPKIGLAVAPGRFHAGRVKVVDIGIPPGLELAGSQGVATPDLLKVVPPKTRWGNKYTAGTVACIGGSVGMAGAIALVSKSALRAGAGVVWGIVPEPIAVELDCSVPEVQFKGVIADESGRHTIAAAERMQPLVEKADAVVFGPGIGDTEQTQALARWAAKTSGRLVLDAQGLRAFAGDLMALGARDGQATLLTPHEGELAALLGIPSDVVRANRLESVKSAAMSSRCTVLLKGEDTIVCDPNGEFLVCRSHSSMATAGSGDVLAGVAGAFLARGLSPLVAGAAATLACGIAAEHASGDFAPSGVIASDVVERLPVAIAARLGDEVRA